MAPIEDALTWNPVKVENNSLFSILRDSLGRVFGKKHRSDFDDNTEWFLQMLKNDDSILAARWDRKGNTIIGNYQPEIREVFEWATINVQKWASSVSWFAQAQTTLWWLNLTNTWSTASGAYSILTSKRVIQFAQRMPVQHKVRKRIQTVANTVVDRWFGAPATTAVPANGVIFYVVNGIVYGRMYQNSAVVIDAPVLAISTFGWNTAGNPFSVLNIPSMYLIYDIVIDDDNILFTIQDSETWFLVAAASPSLPASAYKMFSATALPIYTRVYNSAIPTATPIVVESWIEAFNTDITWNRSIENLSASMRMELSTNPFTWAQTENNTNSAAPTSATLSNTTAWYTTLWGKFQFAAVAWAETDYCLFWFQVPVGTRVGIDAIIINTYNMWAAVATTVSALEWSLVSNLSAVSLATANGIRKSLWFQSLPVGATIWQKADTLIVDFGGNTQYTESGQFVVIAVKLPVGTATASQIIRGSVTVIWKNF